MVSEELREHIALVALGFLLLVLSDALLSISVIHASLVLVLQHFVSFVHVAILLSIFWIPSMVVGMQLPCQSSIRLFDGLLVSSAGNPHDSIVVLVSECDPHNSQEEQEKTYVLFHFN